MNEPTNSNARPEVGENVRVEGKERRVSIVKNDYLAETIVSREGYFQFAVHTNGSASVVPSFMDGDVTIDPAYNLKRMWETGLVKFPSGVEPFGSPARLIEEIKAFIRLYAHVPELWLDPIAHYVLLTWVYDRFTALGYLRFLGEPGTGKTRLQQILAALCYKAMAASGNITGAALFRLIDLIRGTMVVDEADFKDSAEWSDIVKVLNSGYCLGFPVVRCDTSRSFTPEAFHVYGPKIISTRSRFQDHALETRCLTFETKETPLPEHIPYQLPLSFECEVVVLRNKLLRWRFDNFDRIGADESQMRHLEPRLGQIGASLYAVASDEDAQGRIVAFLSAYSEAQRADSPKAIIVQALVQLQAGGNLTPTVKTVTNTANLIASGLGLEYMTPRRVGGIVRSLGLESKRTRDGYTVRLEADRIEYLRQRYGVNV